MLGAVRYLFGSLNAAELDEGRVVLDGSADEFGRLGFTFSVDNNSSLLLQCLLYDLLRSFRVLLSDLFSLYSSCVLLREGQVSDRHIVK